STKRDSLQFSVRVLSNDNETLFESSQNGFAGANEQDITSMQRKATFGGRDLTFVYAIQRNLTREGLLHGMWVAIAGFCLTGAAILLLGFMANRAAILAQEVASRRSAEDR